MLGSASQSQLKKLPEAIMGGHRILQGPARSYPQQCINMSTLSPSGLPGLHKEPIIITVYHV